MQRIEDPVLLVVFGASGDLAQRKLIPALYYLVSQNMLPDRFALIGFARTEYTDDEFRELAEASVRKYRGNDIDERTWSRFAKNLFYQSGQYDELESFEKLAARVEEIDEDREIGGNHLYYLATPPNVFKSITTLIRESALCGPECGSSRRIVIEKPFGHDLESAKELNEHLRNLFLEEQIYRIDHYLGKETVQNIMVFRFGNGIFEPIWNRRYIDHVQITVAETMGIGSRGGYFDRSGAIRDMIQNHLMQLVALTAMEPPVAFEPEAVRDQKSNVLRSIRPLDPNNVGDWVVRAQYDRGVSEGEEIQGYQSEEGIPDDSITETYVAWKLEIDNWRWNGVPFYLRTGKALAGKVTEIHIVFRKPPLLLFESLDPNEDLPSNVLTLRIQPDEGIRLTFDAKRPGPADRIERVAMDFSYRNYFGGQSSADAYERLLLDAMLGDSTLFIRREETELAWERVTRVLAGWEMQEKQAKEAGEELTLPKYAAGTWGPQEADELLTRDGRYWRNPSAARLVG